MSRRLALAPDTAERLAAPPARAALLLARWWWPVLLAAVVSAWVGVALAGSARVPPPAAAVACGTALLAGAAPRRAGVLPGTAHAATLLVLPVAVAEAARGAGAGALGVVVLAVAVASAVARWRDDVGLIGAAVTMVGASALVAGIVIDAVDTDRLQVLVVTRPAAALVLAGAVVLVLAVVLDHDTPPALLGPALLAAVAATPVLPADWIAPVAAAAAVVAARFRHPSAALVALAVAATATGYSAPALLLGSAAVLVVASGLPLATIAALPAAVVLTSALSEAELAVAPVALAVGLALSALLVIPTLTTAARVTVDRVPALALAGWLVVAPGTWTWVGRAPLDAYDEGMARAVAAGLLAVLLLVLRRGAEVITPEPPLAVVPLPTAPPSGGQTGDAPASPVVGPSAELLAAGVAMLAALGCGVWLLLSIVRLQ